VHFPFAHVAPPLQTLSHVPQFFGSLDSVAQVALPPSGVQSVVPLPHVDPHFAPEHTCPFVHAVPHAPQLSRSVDVSTHVFPHVVLGALHVPGDPASPVGSSPPVAQPCASAIVIVAIEATTPTA
jgi:hypothetical protein